jgi:hypothetical protein
MKKLIINIVVVGVVLTVAGVAVAIPRATSGAGPVPPGTTATSVTFISSQTTFVLGTAPCAHRPCTVILRSTDRGGVWQGLPAPVERVSAPYGHGLWGLRFADAQRGYAYGDGLWATADGGAGWHRAPAPARYVADLAPVRDSELVALAQGCGQASSRCADRLSLYHRPIAGGRWRRVATGGRSAFDESIAVHGSVVWALAGTRLWVSVDGGRSFHADAQPCPSHGSSLPEPAAISDDGTNTYLLCTGQGFTGHTVKYLYRTAGTGSAWKLIGRPPVAGDGGTLAAGSGSALVLATASAASWLDRSVDGGHHWRTPLSYGDGGEGWADLGFTTAADGVVIHGPAQTDGGSSSYPGQLLLTGDGGRTWQVTPF